MPFAVMKEILRVADCKKAAFFPTFFKTGKGEYAEGDIFLGISVPDVRLIAKKYQDLLLSDIQKLLHEKYHEARLLALIILTMQYAKGDQKMKKIVVDFYLTQFTRINNWDLVDCSAAQILGDYLRTRPRTMLRKFAKTDHLWTQRIAIVSTFAFIRSGEFDDTLAIATLFLTHQHDLIHKATGWMLREVGKRDIDALRMFLDRHAGVMPRAMLRYAIEKMQPYERGKYLSMRKTAS